MSAFVYIELGHIIAAAVCVICFILLNIFLKGGANNKLVIEHSEKKTRFAILIPARNESVVIDANLSAIRQSNYPVEYCDVYVIVESMDDPTVEICKKYHGVHVFLRKDLSKIGKGPAIDECLTYIFAKNDVYDAFITLDADNIITPGFLDKMSDAYQAGYEAACGRRNNKNWNDSAVSASSGLTFVIINDFQNKRRTSRGMGITFTGTGFYVSADILRRMGGWKFFSLTEDYEFSTFAMCNRLKSCYVEDAMYYDEQPRTWGQSIKQRTRWIKGYFSVRFGYRRMKREYAKNCPRNKDIMAMRLGTFPCIALAVVVIFYLVANIVGASVSAAVGCPWTHLFLIRIGITLGVIYFGVMAFMAYLFYIARAFIKITMWNRIKTLLISPIYWCSYIIVVIRALFTESKWEVIEHSITSVDGEK